MSFDSKSLLRLAAGARLTEGSGRLPILMFHRVLEQQDPLQPDVLTASVFDAQMKMLAGVFNVLPLDKAVESLMRGCLPARTVSITFDDGYRDNIQVALPILKRYGLHATFFVTSGYLGGGCMFNDAVVESLRSARHGTADLSTYGLGVVQVGDVAQRRQLADQITTAIKYFESPKRNEFCRELPKMFGSVMPENLMMSHDEVRTLSNAGMGIGGHTVTHPILAKVSDQQAQQEINDNRAELKDILGYAPTTFAYPNGKPDTDFAPRHAGMVKAAGYSLAVSTAAGVAHPKDSLFSLPRFGLRGDSATTAGMRLLRMTYVEHQPYAQG
ncbi:MAG: polysaccharide deacetylase family protein [Burkholderiaceae bacterium]